MKLLGGWNCQHRLYKAPFRPAILQDIFLGLRLDYVQCFWSALVCNDYSSHTLTRSKLIGATYISKGKQTTDHVADSRCFRELKFNSTDLRQEASQDSVENVSHQHSIPKSYESICLRILLSILPSVTDPPAVSRHATALVSLTSHVALVPLPFLAEGTIVQDH